jgi:hypothetical protein
VINLTLATPRGPVNSAPFTRRIGLCWEAPRAPRWTRKPQAWAAQAVQAGLLRDRQQSEKSQGFGDRVPESSPDQTETKTSGKSALAFSANRRFALNQYSVIYHMLKYQEEFLPLDIVVYELKSQERRMRNLRKHAEELGYELVQKQQPV